MQILNRSEVKFLDKKRQRSSIPTAHVNSLAESIFQRGLLNPPVFFPLGKNEYLLVAGECRMKAIEKIQSEGKSFHCDGARIDPGFLPITITMMDALIDQKQLEYDENAIREGLSWQDKAAAMAEIHALAQARNTKQTFRDTAEEILADATNGGGAAGEVKNPKWLAEKVHEATLINEHLDDPTISKARNANEAYSLILKKQEEQALAALAKRRLAAMPTSTTLAVDLRKGDLLEVLPAMDSSIVDLILTDPPYGVDANVGGFRARTVHHHNYDDTIESAKEVARCILTEGFRITKPGANILMFTDIKHWEWLQVASARIGWVPFRTPIIWEKSDSEGLAPWGAAGPRRTYDVIFYATKGQRGMIASPIDRWNVKRVSRSERIHAAEKPVELLKKAIECTTLPGDMVLDPCCGSGSALIAARELKRFAIGIEKDQTYFDTAMANVFKNGVSDGIEGNEVGGSSQTGQKKSAGALE